MHKQIKEFEIQFFHYYGIGLNEAILLNSLNDQIYSSSKIADILKLSLSNASKVIKSVEQKGLIERMLGQEDKRQMYFILTKKGHKKLSSIEKEAQAIGDVVQKIKAIDKPEMEVSHPKIG
jgi:DNA-binding MarR family transcriptional regulator